MARPLQRVSDSKKFQNINVEGGPESSIATETIDHYISNATFMDYAGIQSQFAAAEGELIKDDYDYVLKPWGEDTPDRNIPAQLFNYGAIIPPIIDKMMGEFRQRDLTGQVISKSPESYNKKKSAEYVQRTSLLQQIWINEANKMGFDTDLPTLPIDFEAEMAQWEEAWADDITDNGQNALGLIDYELDLQEKFIDGFYYALCNNCLFTYKYVFGNRMEYEIIHPSEIGFVASRNIKYLEEAEAVVRKKKMTLVEVIENFGDWFTEEEIGNIENSVTAAGINKGITMNDFEMKGRTETTSDFPIGPLATIHIGRPIDLQNEGLRTEEWDIYHCVARTQVELGTVIETDEMTGESYESFVKRDSLIDESQVLSWNWYSALLEGYKIGPYFKGIDYLKVTRRRRSNPMKIYGPYNGRIFRGLSYVDKLKPFEHLFNFNMYQMMRMIGSNKNKFFFLPLSIIPNRDDMNMWDFMHFLTNEGVAFVEDLDASVLQALQYMKQIDVSLNEHINYLMRFSEEIKAMAMDRVGFTPQRLGEIKASESVGNAQQNMINSSLISEDFILNVMTLYEKEQQGLLDMSPNAWGTGTKTGTYLNSEKQKIDYAIHGDMLYEDMGVYFKYSPKEKAKMNKMADYAFAMLQNGGSHEAVIEIIGADNMNQIRRVLRKNAAVQKQVNAQVQEMEANKQQFEQAMKQLELKLKDKEIEKEFMANLNSDATKERIANRQLIFDLQGMVNEQGQPQTNPNEIMKVVNDRLKLMSDRDINKESNQIKREDIKAKERMNKDNNRVALKNKVVGEK